MRTLLIAHRGANDVLPENTLAAFDYALRQGFKAVECDIHLTKDHKLAVIHDATLERTTNGKGWVHTRTLEELKQLETDEGQHIPSLNEVLSLVVLSHNRRLIIEIKAESEPMAIETAKKLVSVLQHLSKKRRILLEVHSFWYPALKIVKSALPRLTTAAIIDGDFPVEQLATLARQNGIDGFSISSDYLSKQFVKACQHNHLFVDSWTVNDQTTYRRLRGLKLRGILKNLST